MENKGRRSEHYTVSLCCNMVNIPQNIRNRHPIARPWQSKILCVQSLMQGLNFIVLYFITSYHIGLCLTELYTIVCLFFSNILKVWYRTLISVACISFTCSRDISDSLQSMFNVCFMKCIKSIPVDIIILLYPLLSYLILYNSNQNSICIMIRCLIIVKVYQFRKWLCTQRGCTPAGKYSHLYICND